MQILKSCKSWFRLCLLLACVLPSYAQEYVLNGDFEEYDFLPTDLGQLDYCKYWFMPTGGTTDYAYMQTTNDFYGGFVSEHIRPCGQTTLLYPNRGKAMAGFYIYSGYNYREYASTQLTQQLRKGKRYTFSMYLINGNTVHNCVIPNVACNGVQVAFTPIRPNQFNSDVLNLNPTYSIGYRFFSDTWVKISHTFVANGDEAYMTIGNFKNNANTDTMRAYIGRKIWAFTDSVYPNPVSYIFIDSVSLRPTKIPISSPKLKDTLCLGQSIKLIAVGEKNLSWYQLPQDSLIAQGDSILTVSPTKSTKYRAVGNSDTLIFSVTIQPPPHIPYSDTSTCQPLGLFLGKTTRYDSLKVSPKTDSLRNTGTYLLTAYQNGCSAQKSILYTREDCKEDTLRFSICEGDTLLLPSKTLTTHTWYKQTTLLQTSTDQEFQVQPSTSTYYRVKGFSDYRLFEVTVRSKPIIPFEDQQFCPPFEWLIPYVADTLLVNNQKMDTITKAGLYEFFAQQDGCKANKTVLIAAPECPKPDSILHIPNAFSPNGDGLNDVWQLRGIQQYPNAIMNVYNRWGNIVYTSSPGYPVPWDGTRNGYPMAVATYYYILELKNGEEETMTGGVTIVR